MERRNFIVCSVLTAATVSTPFLKCTSSSDPALDKKLAIPQILSQLLDENGLMDIGKKYGTIHPNEYSLKTLELQLKKSNEGNSFSSNTSPKEIYNLLDKKIQNDFEANNIIILNGWILSLTEARQCALFSLMPLTK